MNILSICGVAFLCLCAVLVVRENGYKTFSIVVSCTCALTIILYSLRSISEGISRLWGVLANGSELRYADVVIKSFGIAFVCEVSSDCIRDLGENTVASALEIAAKAEIMLLCISPMLDVISGALSLAGQVV